MTMRYLGSFSGNGVLKWDGHETALTTYEFDGFVGGQGDVTSSGEIRCSAAALKRAFAARSVHLLTAGGRRLGLHFSEKKLPIGCHAAHVEVTGELPTSGGWVRPTTGRKGLASSFHLPSAGLERRPP